jgi:phosphohistidine phosphatase
MTEHVKILLMRHGHAKVAEARQTDASRLLDEEGRSEARRIGRLLSEKGIVPDFVLASTAKRTEETARIVLDGLGLDLPVHSRASLYLAEPRQILDAFLEVHDAARCVLVVGHNPGIAELVTVMTEEYCSMPTAGLAEIRVGVATPRKVARAPRGRLLGFHRPPPKLRDSEAP